MPEGEAQTYLNGGADIAMRCVKCESASEVALVLSPEEAKALGLPGPALPKPLRRSYRLPALVLNASIAKERVLDGPEDLTDETAAQNGLHAYRGQDGRSSCNEWGA